MINIDAIKAFKDQCNSEITAQGNDIELKDLSQAWIESSCKNNYCYHFAWFGRPIIQYPQDIIAIQEVLWEVKPDLVIECGVAHGGSLIMSASIQDSSFIGIFNLFLNKNTKLSLAFLK